MSRILYPTDFSPASRAAFARALKLAKTDRAELVIAHVLPPVLPATADGYAVPASTYRKIEESSRRYAQKGLNRLIAKARRLGVRARGLLLEGNAQERIVAAARRQHADMIVMGTHGRTGFARFVLGSVAGRVVAHAGCPVLTVRGRG
jgi:nucleotide-binding universal stress UspA family protein